MANIPARVDWNDKRVNAKQRLRWNEIISMRHVSIWEVKVDNIDEGYLIMELDRDDASRLGIFEFLSISPIGTVAVYDRNHPIHHNSFKELLAAQTSGSPSSR